MLRNKGITVTENMDRPLRPGSVVFVETPEGVTHRNYVTQAWTRTRSRKCWSRWRPALTRMASAPSPANR